ncbi:30S ribosomal protein S15 [Promethearchaeum syntrophicum]|uniref:Small ribosomal subunit protein uS15 n=1 Tax=Promethearchaeum syntrophicum TaxID=2594042 RepID=A0A5B9DCP8_9ARCH|nr:30S ribosomal protein S15 [Candidatus Prometheoarchaeum syntrophicum]QEE16892.1 30S ribosomal protein S15 [Candidatus Prometheoarchaeum syntrophicum]
MARMHSRKKGKSGSKRPAKLEILPWYPHTSEEVEAKVIELAKKGESMSSIGLQLRDGFGTPLVKIITGKTISTILKENDLSPKLPEDITFLSRQAVKVRRHLEENKKDLEAKKGLGRVEAKIRRLVKYYRKKGVLEPDFKYDPEKIKIFLR